MSHLVSKHLKKMGLLKGKMARALFQHEVPKTFWGGLFSLPVI